jgi:hypothetical protein
MMDVTMLLILSLRNGTDSGHRRINNSLHDLFQKTVDITELQSGLERMEKEKTVPVLEGVP